ncbi:MAG: potassium transporter TrkG [Bacteroidales bacterium]
MNQSNRKLNIRERIFKWIFLTSDRYKIFITWFSSLCRFLFTIAFFLFIAGFLFYIGFSNSEETRQGLRSTFKILFLILFLSKYLPEMFSVRNRFGISSVFRLFVFLFTLGVFLSNFIHVNSHKVLWNFFRSDTPALIAIILIGTSEFSRLLRIISSVKVPPALIFSASFLIIILTGSGLLMLPNAHSGPLPFLDSLFTSVSAVCVTGLVVVDTATAFTTLGKIIILILIQIGGLGIMTFTGFFGYIFISGASFGDRILLRELFSSETLNNLFKILAKIILLTLLTEVVGGLIIYSGLDPDYPDKVLFSVFHAVSAFCNAGFSTLSGNLFSTEISGNHIIQISVCMLIILGGIGFPVLLALYSNLKHQFIVLLKKIMRKMTPVKPEQKNLSVRIVLFMTVILIIAGTLLYYIFESDKSLYDIDPFQKIIISFFGSVSARTAGFNIVDISNWSYPTIFMMIVLMWIGASPGSTGGGIKTTTFALAFRSTWNYIRGRDYLKIGNREIGNNTIIRVLSIIFLSILFIGTGFFCLLLSEPGKDPSHLLFECFSAYGTVGLSLANTASFSDAGKIVDIFLMFIGRVGPLTLLTGIMLSYRKRYSRFPEIDIIIN